ncbi:MAG: hypothetical protein IJ736_10525, partial [Firmicutes bacterium]|nr:hypothetical protein [Bacillota bacterium]
LRSVSHIIGGTTEWNAVSKTAKITLNKTTAEYTLGEPKIKLINEHIYIPIREVADNFDIGIDFDPVLKKVLLSSAASEEKEENKLTESGSLEKVSSASSFAARLNA